MILLRVVIFSACFSSVISLIRVRRGISILDVLSRQVDGEYVRVDLQRMFLLLVVRMTLIFVRQFCHSL